MSKQKMNEEAFRAQLQGYLQSSDNAQNVEQSQSGVSYPRPDKVGRGDLSPIIQGVKPSKQQTEMIKDLLRKTGVMNEQQDPAQTVLQRRTTRQMQPTEPRPQERQVRSESNMGPRRVDLIRDSIERIREGEDPLKLAERLISRRRKWRYGR